MKYPFLGKTALTAVLGSTLLLLAAGSAQAATVDGTIGAAEYSFNSDLSGSDYYRDRRGSSDEFNDAIGGTPWDLTYLGIEIEGSMLNFGIQGGDILDGRYGDYRLGHIGINVDDDDFLEYGIIFKTSRYSGPSLTLYEAQSWQDKDYSYRHTDYYKLDNKTFVASLDTAFVNGGSKDRNTVVEGQFDLSLLSLFDLQSGGKISMYLTMSCVNDEIFAEAMVSPSQVPAPAAVWLLGSGLLGLIGYRKKRMALA